MTEEPKQEVKDNLQKPSALKHGAFSKILFLPGEDPAEFDQLLDELNSEFQPTGRAEEEIIEELARAKWVARRQPLFQHVTILQMKKKRENSYEYVRVDGKLCKKRVDPPKPAETVDEALLELGEIVTLDYVAKELDVDAKLQAKIDRLLRRFWQIRVEKQLRIPKDGKTIEGRATPH